MSCSREWGRLPLAQVAPWPVQPEHPGMVFGAAPGRCTPCGAYGIRGDSPKKMRVASMPR